MSSSRRRALRDSYRVDRHHLVLSLLISGGIAGCAREPCDPAETGTPQETDTETEDGTSPQVELMVEARGTWLWPEWGADPETGPEAMEAEIQRLLDLGFNLFVPLVDNYSAYYPSEQVSIYEGWDAYDYPRHFIDTVHANDPDGLAEVHLWTAVFHVADLLEEHPEYASVHRDGTQDTTMGCPARPEVRARALAVVEELMDRYPDGVVHLDYVRYTDDACFCDTCRAAYEAEHGVDPIELESSDETWVAWRAGWVTTFVQQVRDAAEARDPVPFVSAAVFSNPGPREARVDMGQDWAAWLDQGLVDVAMPMAYTPVNADWVNRIGACLDNTDPEQHVYMDLGTWLHSEAKQIEEAARQVELARVLEADGTVMFRASYIDDDLAVSLEDLYEQPAVLPHRAER